MIDSAVIDIVRRFLMSRITTINTHLLAHVRRVAIRSGAWWRVNPFRRALIDSAIAYLRSGFVIRSRSLLGMIRDVLVEVLTLISTRRLSFIAYVLGSMRAIARGVNPVILGLQLLNTPPQYRWLPQ
ncbi:MAG: hypothetical protein RXP99_05295 [Vulcanisaeta sp.]|nr:hypothetical protein [Vulcanisaeta sp.]MCG2891948.1 hypothetical protein [Vulcanisaeta sp.]MCG2894616.1 hypothetical protein [Vulcanisaeta sp.]